MERTKENFESTEAGSVTQVSTEDPDTSTRQEEEYVLHLQPPADAPRVRWSTDTVDNEGLNKKKSKCCCIYKKKREWNESDSESDCETGHCRGHVDKSKKPPGDRGSGDDNGGLGPSSSNTA